MLTSNVFASFGATAPRNRQAAVATANFYQMPGVARFVLQFDNCAVGGRCFERNTVNLRYSVVCQHLSGGFIDVDFQIHSNLRAFGRLRLSARNGSFCFHFIFTSFSEFDKEFVSAKARRVKKRSGALPPRRVLLIN
jgi:hypothetical protein